MYVLVPPPSPALAHLALLCARGQPGGRWRHWTYSFIIVLYHVQTMFKLLLYCSCCFHWVMDLICYSVTVQFLALTNFVEVYVPVWTCIRFMCNRCVQLPCVLVCTICTACCSTQGWTGQPSAASSSSYRVTSWKRSKTSLKSIKEVYMRPKPLWFKKANLQLSVAQLSWYCVGKTMDSAHVDVVGYTAAVLEKHSESWAGNPIGGTLLAPDQTPAHQPDWLPDLQERIKEL